MDNDMQSRPLSKAEAKAQAKIAKAEAKARIAESKKGSLKKVYSFNDGVAISLYSRKNRAELVVSGLSEAQLGRLWPHVAREVEITLSSEKSKTRSFFAWFMREGVFQTVVKVVAGLIVGYLLFLFGLR